MAVEAYIAIRPQGNNGIKLRGDFLVVKPVGSPWSDEERKRVITIEDADLTAALGVRPLKSYPLAEFTNDSNGQPYMTNRSRKYVDIDGLPANDKSAILAGTKRMDELRADQIVVRGR